MRIRDIIHVLENVAPTLYQESYDNAGLIVGDPEWECTGVLTCLDSTEPIVAEAIEKGCNLIVAHHPILFRALKQLTGANYVERTLIAAIQNRIAIYAIHTNLDNVLVNGVNQRIGDRLGLQQTRILKPRYGGLHFSLYAHEDPESDMLKLKSLGVRELASHALPSGENRLSGMADPRLLDRIRDSFPGRDLKVLREENQAGVGSGLIGKLPQPMEEIAFLQRVGEQMQTPCIRHTALRGRLIRFVALCGGAGGFLLPKAIAEGADAFLTADFKYHEFFDADGKVLLADIGHFESEQFTIDLLFEVLSSKFPNFAFYSTEVVTNPVHYFFTRD